MLRVIKVESQNYLWEVMDESPFAMAASELNDGPDLLYLKFINLSLVIIFWLAPTH